MEDTHFVVIRPFRREDHQAALSLVVEATMDPVNRFFLRALFKEMFYQVMIMIAAILYILCGVPLQYTVMIAPPLTLVLAYVGIFASHWYKAKYLHPDMANVMKTYRESDKTNFFVAEAYYNPGQEGWKKEKPGFLTEVEFEKLDNTGNISNNRALTRELVGCIGVMRARESAVIAWLRRTAVKKEWRGKGVGGALVERVIKFCSQKGFVGIELVTTECHDSARILYEKKGFDIRAFYHKKFFKLSGCSVMMFAMHFKTRPYKETTTSL